MVIDCCAGNTLWGIFLWLLQMPGLGLHTVRLKAVQTVARSNGNEAVITMRKIVEKVCLFLLKPCTVVPP